MADITLVKISALPAAEQIGAEDLLPVVQEGATKAVAYGVIKDDIAEELAPDATLSEAGKAADAKAVGDALALKADKTELTAEVSRIDAALATKANTNDVNAALATKANTDDVTAALALKADTATVNAGLSLKADKTELTAGLATKQNVLTFDSTPTQGSTNPVTSGGIYQAIPALDDTLTVAGDAADAKITGDAITELKNDLGDEIDNVGEYAKETIVKVLEYPLLPFEIGAINISTSGWTYQSNNKRIRTPEGKEIWLNSGDVISLTDYTDARFYLGVRQADGTYLTASWKTADFTVVYEGWYVMLIAHMYETSDLANVRELADLVRITRLNTLQSEFDFVKNQTAHMGVNMIPYGKNLTYAEVPFEKGQISISSGGESITYTASNSGIRIPQDVGGIPLKSGDVIGLTDYTLGKFELLYYANGVYTSLSTRAADYTVVNDGVYYLVIHDKNAVNITDINKYASLFFVTRANDLASMVDDITEDLQNPLSYTQYPFDVYPIHGINHRGMQYEAPENTLPAFRLSVQAGYHFVETDVQFTSDNVPVLLHDPTLNRTARNADGTELTDTVYIKDITYAQALEYDFSVVNGTYDSNFDGNKIMTFEDFIVFCKRTEIFPYLELKSETTYTQAQVNILIDLLTKYKFLRNVSWLSWSDDWLRFIVNADKGARVGRIKNSEISGAAAAALNTFKTGYNRVFWSINPFTNDWNITESSFTRAMANNQGISIGVISTKAGMTNVLDHFTNSGYITGCLSNGRVNFADVVKEISMGTGT